MSLNSMRAAAKKYFFQNHLLQGVFYLALGIFIYFGFAHHNEKKEVNRLEKNFQSKVVYLEQALDEFSNAVNFGDDLRVIWENTSAFRNLGYEYFVFHGDSLLFWTTNHVVLPSLSLTNEKPELVLLENGWYFKTQRRSSAYTMVGMFLVKYEYPYENENLINNFNADFDFHFRGKIERIPDEYDIHLPDGSFCFSVNNLFQHKPGALVELLLMLCVLVALTQFLYSLWLAFRKRRTTTDSLALWLGLFVILLIRIVLYSINWKLYFNDFELFNPNIFASSIYSPTLADLIINVLLLVAAAEIFMRLLRRFFRQSPVKDNLKNFVFAGSLGLFFVLSILLEEFITEIISNSDVALNYYNILSLSPISYAFIVIFFGLFWAYFRLISALLIQSNQLAVSTNIKGLLWFIFATSYLIIEIFVNDQLLVLSLFSITLSIILLYFGKPGKTGYRFLEIVVLLLVNTLYLSLLINHTQNEKELATRAIYAKKLISEKELETEMEYASLADRLTQSSVLQDFYNNPDVVQIPEVKKYLERKFFQEYWSRYEIEFYFYDADTSAISTYVQIKDDPAANFEKIIKTSGIKSETAPNMYYVSDFANNLSYLIRQPIQDSTDMLKGYLYLALRSKIIPQEIGFPRLLINENSNVFFKLEDYNMAKYVHGNLALRYGSFNYPISIGSFLIDFKKKSGVVEDGDFVHLITHGDRNKTIILTKSKVGFEAYLTSFSFLFSAFGILLILGLIVSGDFMKRWVTLKLAFRIQLLFVALVFFSLLFSGLGTGTYVKSQYFEYQEDQLREKVNAVQKELFNKLQYEERLEEATLVNYLELC